MEKKKKKKKKNRVVEVRKRHIELGECKRKEERWGEIWAMELTLYVILQHILFFYSLVLEVGS